MVAERRFREVWGVGILAAAFLTAGPPEAKAIEIGSELHGAPRRWEAGMAVGSYSTLNLRTGRVHTRLPIVGWEGRGPSISMSFFHNMTSEIGILPIETGGGAQGIMGDANGDGELDLADVDPFLDIVMSGSPSEEQLAIADFSGNAQADSVDVEGFGEALGMALDGPEWRHSYSASLTTQSQGNTVMLIRDDGTTDKFTWYDPPGNDPASYVSPAGVYEKLVKETNGSQIIGFMLTSKNQWRTHFALIPGASNNFRLDWIADATVELDEDDKPFNRVECTYYTGTGQPWEGRLWKVTDAAGRVLELTYNADTWIREIKDPVDRVWTLLYQDAGDPNGYSADGDGYFIALQDSNPAHPPITWDYTEDYEIYWIADKNYDTHWFGYFEGRLVDVQDPLGLQQSFEYVGTLWNEVIGRYTDRRGSEWEYWFKTNQVISVSGVNKTLPMFHLIKTINPLGETVQFQYNDLRHPPADPVPTSGAPLAWYAPHRHEATARLNPLWKQWDYTYEPITGLVVNGDVLRRGNMAWAKDPLDNSWTLVYDEFNNVTSFTTPGDAPSETITTTLEYNATTIDPTVPTKVTLPEDQFQQTAEVNMTYWADEYLGHARGKLQNVTDANGVETIIRYDSKGQVSRVDEGPSVGTWQKVYRVTNRDPLGRVMTAIQYGQELTQVAMGLEASASCPVPAPQCSGDGVKIDYDSCTCSVTISCADCVPSFSIPCPDEEESCDSGSATSGLIEESVVTGYTIPEMCATWGIPGNPRLKGVTGILRDAMGRPTTMDVEDGIDTSTHNGNAPPDSTQTFDYDALGRLTSLTAFTKEVRVGTGGGNPAGITREFGRDYDDINGIYTRTGQDGQTTTTETDTAGRAIEVERRAAGGALLLSADYTYYATGRVETITNGNGTVVEYVYDDAERLTLIRHKQSATGATFLEMEYDYSPRGLITGVTETGANGWSATVMYTYDDRGRLIAEQRTGSQPYWLTYTYDAGGNRKTKKLLDASEQVLFETVYHYDTDDEMVDCDGDGDFESTPAQCYKSKNNRLMFCETTDADDFRIERVDYQYELTRAAAGNPNYIVRTVWDADNPGNPPVHYGYTLQYNSSGELWFLTQQTWTGDCASTTPTLESCHEFRASGRAMRLTTKRDLSDLKMVVPDSRVWHDYDGDEIYADARIDFDANQADFSVTELASHQASSSYDQQTTAKNYRHGDQIDSTRLVSDSSAATSGRVVYTAFGERVWSDGTVGTRYQYAGAWGYQTMPEFASGFSSGFDGSPGDEVPFVHVGHRWYDPSTGRFVQADPIGIRGGLNVFSYVRNSPLAFIDPRGLDIRPNRPMTLDEFPDDYPSVIPEDLPSPVRPNDCTVSFFNGVAVLEKPGTTCGLALFAMPPAVVIDTVMWLTFADYWAKYPNYAATRGVARGIGDIWSH